MAGEKESYVSRRSLVKAGAVVPPALAISALLGACGPDRQSPAKQTPTPNPDKGNLIEVQPSESKPSILLPDISKEQSLAERQLKSTYDAWKTSYLEPRGAGGLDVVAHGNFPPVEGHRISEGRGYGMILSAMMEDKITMDALITSDLAVQNPNGLSPWDINEHDVIKDKTAATDGDEDMAFGAILAHKQWGDERYKTYAINKINAIMKHTVEPDTMILKPGDTWGGSKANPPVINPSYLRPFYYKLFAEYTKDPRWNAALDTNLAVIQEKIANPTTGLVPDWATVDGQSAGQDGKKHYFAWDAVRYPMFLAQYVLVTQDERALDQLMKLNRTFKNAYSNNSSSALSLNGQRVENERSEIFINAAATTAMVDPDADYRNKMLNRLINMQGTYYDNSLKLLSLGIISGRLLLQSRSTVLS
jgi:endo-1,4-beta-D-glucanase Y